MSVENPGRGRQTRRGRALGRRFPDLPVMTVTAYSEDERRHSAVEFLTKPVDFERLMTQLGQLPGAPDRGNSPFDRMTAYPPAAIDPQIGAMVGLGAILRIR